MSKSNVVFCENNGVRAILLEEDFDVLKNCPYPEQALSYGVHWYVFMTFRRLLRAEADLLGAPIATTYDFDFLMREGGWQDRSRDEDFFVPFSNGPGYYQEEKKFIFPLTELIFRAAKVKV